MHADGIVLQYMGHHQINMIYNKFIYFVSVRIALDEVFCWCCVVFLVKENPSVLYLCALLLALSQYFTYWQYSSEYCQYVKYCISFFLYQFCEIESNIGGTVCLCLKRF